MTLTLLITLPFLGSLLAALQPTNARNREAWLAGGIAFICLVLAAIQYPEIVEQGVLSSQIEWVPSLGLDFTLRLDGLAWIFLLLIFGIGALVSVYARYYMSPEDPVPRFFAFLLAFMGAMVGVVLSGNLIQLVLFWELTSLVSFMLIGYWHHRADARRGARMALTITAAGGLCLFAGVLMLGQIVGSYSLDDVLSAGDRIRAHPWYLPMLILVALGALTKSAQFPFQFWLPNAMAAPTPVSAYLHSATMVKAGVFLLARLWPALSGTDEWFWIIGTAGLCTLLIGAYNALFQQDLKGVLAYSTISHLGLITLLLGLNSQMAAVAAVFHIMNHATFKASLFMAAGIVDHEAGTRDLRRLGGLRRSMPYTATLAIVACAAMAGVPLLNGFLSKEMFFAETVYLGGEGSWMSTALPVLATVAGTFSVAYSLRFVYATFFGSPRADLPREPHEPPRWMRFPVEALVFLCLLVGIVPQRTVGPLLEVGAAAMLQSTPPEYSLAIWHGINLPLMMSVVALVAGVMLYKALLPWLRSRTVMTVPVTGWFDGRRTYRALLIRGSMAARTIGRVFSTRKLQKQLLLVVVVAFAAGATPLWLGHGLSRGPVPTKEINPVFVVFWAIGMACAIGAAYQAKYHRLAALIMLGGAGLVTCLTYVWFSAPDLALTQLMVEIVTTTLMLLGLRWLPKRFEPQFARGAAGLRGLSRARGRRVRDLVVAIVGGSGVGALAFAVLTRPFPESVANHYLARSLSEGGGANTVNVIIVDFRGFDTMGEIVVLGVVALTVFALLRRFRPPPESLETPHQRRIRTIDEMLEAEEAAEIAAELAAREQAEAVRRAALAAQAVAADAVRAAIETQEAHEAAVAQGLVQEVADGPADRASDEEAAERIRRKRIERHAIDSATGDFVLPAIVLRLMMPLAGLVSVYLFLRGHNNPGGGFVAGLVFAVAIIMQYMVSGTDWVEAHMSLRPVRWIAVGLLLAAGTGASAIVSGLPWLSSQDVHLHLPVIGELHLSTVMVFDLGVFALVVGATILILIALAHQSRRRHRAIVASGRQRATATVES